MRTFIYIGVVVGILTGIGFAAYGPIVDAINEANKPNWRISKVDTGDILSSVDATGTVRPVLSIQIGAFVSGPIEKLHVEFNQEVSKNELLAEIDSRLYDAAEKRDQATLQTREAEKIRIDALLEQAKREEARAKELRADNAGYISQSELDQYVYNVKTLEAQLTIAKASILQAEANLLNSKQNVSYTKIRAPEAGIIIDRKVEPGQTLTAQFQTPEMFVIAPRMREKMHVFADVDEVDIGKIIEAWNDERPVKFTVDSYPEDLFEGRISEVRYSATETQNVVTYPVVVETTNADLKLLPGMTATIEFQVQKKEGCIRVPNSAIRFLPDKKYVHPDDQPILEGSLSTNDQDNQGSQLTASQKQEAEIRRNKRHVWIQEGDFLRAIEITVGISDNRYTAVNSGNLKSGQQLVTGLKPKSEQ
ncbi:MAG: efflux RND transporter periplasmic adaptor subunit [Pirellulaceae bacterium]|nr:efflux RND transporter periplasmic adaptor subunit [Mariniblastus sp.]MDB4671204.1 efflux RND transporter periplasmic adaptor subunit [Pirellulaceae bacterium]MDB4755997.1 efflux RND transporter periplasmic adaptor subunit [Mariniblastus sp.]MDG2469712.1 efflux RND transporter periplasmic adaptor subunit [Pirellulaceae bacterium]